jgi:hypothetical protein
MPLCILQCCEQGSGAVPDVVVGQRARHAFTSAQAELAELLSVGRSTIYRTLDRLRPAPPEPERPFAHLASQKPTQRG